MSNEEKVKEIQRVFNPPWWGSAVDYFFNKVMPKKFIVFVTATIFLWGDKISGEHWFYISIAYLTGNVVQKIPQLVGKK